jgi:AraC family transcriptional regulator of adaptative response/methylated-DNA-[protein]-cysteine methyltransferase
MFRAFEAGDGEYDGIFVTAVRTTGIFCRPSCPARKPKRENVEFFDSPKGALTAGYRPCRRCKPMNAHDEAPEWVGKLVELAEATPTRKLTDEDLRAKSIDPVRARRYFKQHYGMTWQAYHRAIRLGGAFAQLSEGSDALSAGFAHGWESASAFAEAFKRVFGTTAGRAGNAERMVVTWVDSPIGPFVAGAVDDGLCLFEFADRRSIEKQIKVNCARMGICGVPGMNDVLARAKDEVARYFAGTLTKFSIPLSPRGTPFQERVWKALRDIPYGETRSYDDIARAVDAAGARRAVGRANGQNPIAIIVPCHRVIGADGKLCGYGGGLWRKQFLLDLERTVVMNRAGEARPARERNESWRSSASTRARNGRAKSATAALFAPAGTSM